MPTGHYEYQVMPYRLVNILAVFQNFMHDVLRNFLQQFIIVYVDDILIFFKSDVVLTVSVHKKTSLLQHSE